MSERGERTPLSGQVRKKNTRLGEWVNEMGERVNDLEESNLKYLAEEQTGSFLKLWKRYNLNYRVSPKRRLSVPCRGRELISKRVHEVRGG